MIATLIPLLANTLMTILTGQGISSPAIQDLVDRLVALGTSLFVSLKSGQSTGSDVSSVLATLQDSLTAIEQDTSADPAVVSQVQEIIKMIEAGITAEQQAEQVTDPSTLTPLDPVE